MRRPAPSRRAVRNTLATLDALANGAPLALEATQTRGRQPEGYVNDDIARWRARQSGLVLERNKRRVATLPNGQRVMFGWLRPGSADWIGYRALTITPEMVGTRIAQFVAIEAKSEAGRTGDQQQAFLDEVGAAGGVAGVVRSGEEAARLIESWRRA